MVFFLHIKIL